MSEKVARVRNSTNRLVSVNVSLRRNYRKERYIEVVECRESEEGQVLAIIRNGVPKYDMRYLNNKKPRFSTEDYDEELYIACIKSSEGMRIVNELKNRLTDRVINEYVKNCKSNIKIDKHKLSRGAVPSLKPFLEGIERTPIEGNNLLPNRCIGLRKEVIWEAFKSSGLVEKNKITKKQRT